MYVIFVFSYSSDHEGYFTSSGITSNITTAHQFTLDEARNKSKNFKYGCEIRDLTGKTVEIW